MHLNKQGVLYKIYRDKQYYAFVVPAILFIFLFIFYPAYYLQIAFKAFRVTIPLEEAKWVGLQYFKEILGNHLFRRAFTNTIIINLQRLVIGFPVPIILSLLLNEIRHQKYKRLSQTLFYLPHFVAWTVVAGLTMNFLSYDTGLINNVISHFGGERTVFMASNRHFRGILVATGIWKEAGWGTVLYLATISRINPELYSAAEVDGASRFQRMIHITLPGLMDIMVVLLILSVGNLLTNGFEQVLVMYNERVYEVGDVLQTYVYRTGLLNNRYSYATAAGLFNSVLAMILLFGTDYISKRFSGRGLV